MWLGTTVCQAQGVLVYAAKVFEQVCAMIQPVFRKINLEAADRVDSCRAGVESVT